MFLRLSSRKSAASTSFYRSNPRKRRREFIRFSLTAARPICLWKRPSLRLVSVNCGTSSVYRGRSFTNVPDRKQGIDFWTLSRKERTCERRLGHSNSVCHVNVSDQFLPGDNYAFHDADDSEGLREGDARHPAGCQGYRDHEEVQRGTGEGRRAARA